MFYTMRLLTGIVVLIVDGGHRAIKYSRINGVKKDIYSEGMEAAPAFARGFLILTAVLYRNAYPDPMV